MSEENKRPAEEIPQERQLIKTADENKLSVGPIAQAEENALIDQSFF
ncbi:MAG: hypothetical protein ABI266_04610 [Ginsengibacter sp.]